jgi:hypothetical protein
MPSPQLNLRVPSEHHAILKRVASRLREDVAFKDQLAALVAGVAAPVAGVAGDSIVARLEARLEALEEREPRMVRIEALEARLEVLEALRGTGQGGSQTAAEAAGEALDASEATQEAPGGPQTRRKWTAEDDAALRRIHAEGGIPEDARRQLGRPSSVIIGKWKALGLPVQPRAGRKLGKRQKDSEAV